MILTPVQSWGLLLILAAGVIGMLWLASRPSWTHRHRARRAQTDLDELQRHIAARQAIRRQVDQSNIRIVPRKDPDE